MKIKIGGPLYSDFGMRADNVIEECRAVPAGAHVAVRVGKKLYRLIDTEVEYDFEKPVLLILEAEEDGG